VVDLHCHVLPALDDGALDLADSIAMLREAERDGIDVVCATPHIRDDHDVRIEELPGRVASLQAAADEHGVGVRIAQGGEVAQFAVERLSAEHLQAVSLDGGGWVLLEPGPGEMADELPALARRLADRGTHVIVAHPERHAGHDFEQRLRELAACRCLLQWTAETIAQTDPGDPDSFILRLLREGLVHLISTDAHSSHGGRPLRMSAAVERLREVCPPELLSWIVERAPQAILRGEAVTSPW
jgi:protein-tyrosine phosphatase